MCSNFNHTSKNILCFKWSHSHSSRNTLISTSLISNICATPVELHTTTFNDNRTFTILNQLTFSRWCLLFGADLFVCLLFSTAYNLQLHYCNILTRYLFLISGRVNTRYFYFCYKRGDERIAWHLVLAIGRFSKKYFSFFKGKYHFIKVGCIGGQEV